MAELVSLGDRLKLRRAELGLSQAQAARELDVARTAYRLWELEVAKPAPDRWRLLSRWLGISVSAMLLADELISESEAGQSEVTEAHFGRSGGDWDTDAAAMPGDFFQQSRSLMEGGIASGAISEEQAEELRLVLDRLEAEHRRTSVKWAAGELRKSFPAVKTTVQAARDAVSLVAGDIPTDALETALLLTSELVSNSVKHGPPPPATVGVSIQVLRDRLRVEVSDAAAGIPTLSPPGPDGGYGLTVVDRLATRWDTHREGSGNLTWFELALRTPGA